MWLNFYTTIISTARFKIAKGSTAVSLFEELKGDKNETRTFSACEHAFGGFLSADQPAN